MNDKLEKYQNAFKHLKKDPVMKRLIEKLGENIDLENRKDKDLAKAISKLIIEQQVSFKAAITIKKRFIKKVEDLSNDEIIELKDKDLQSIGISYRKATYIRNVFIFFKDCSFDFIGASNQEVINELTTIKGIGAWSSEMFLMFVLMRINIFSKGDLALMNSIKINYKIDIKDQSKVNSLVDSWSPYKSVACLLLWKSIEEKYFYT